MSEAVQVQAVQDELGEGPLWHPGEQALYWVDIENNIYHRFVPSSGSHEVVNVGERIRGAGVPQEGGHGDGDRAWFCFLGWREQEAGEDCGS